MSNPQVEPVVTPAPEPKVEPKVEATPEPKEKVSTEPQKIVPEKYELKASEGSFLEAEDLEGIAAIAKQQGLSQKEAEALLVNQEKYVAERVSRRASQWKEQTQNDKELGGTNFAEVAEKASRVVEKFGSPAFKEYLARSGNGNHPEWVRFVWNISKHFADDKAIFPGAKPGGVEKSIEQKLYPTMFPNT